ncbi:MAG: GntR family transcriptional regulator, partial [Motiliproteus sp.]|nr:GntR family transcriptional regulator [Motiliproteus sp.]
MLLYQQLADELTELIRQGVYRSGEKLPSLREQARQRQLSIPTVQRAYDLLEDRRMIEVRPKSGFYVCVPVNSARQIPPPSEILPPAPAEVNVHELATGVFLRCDQTGIVNLGTAYPSSHYLPVKSLQRIAANLVRQDMRELLEAHFTPGTDQLRHV